jgi:hypothetical protein
MQQIKLQLLNVSNISNISFVLCNFAPEAIKYTKLWKQLKHTEDPVKQSE